jgi:hypothetical protein
MYIIKIKILHPKSGERDVHGGAEQLLADRQEQAVQYIPPFGFTRFIS